MDTEDTEDFLYWFDNWMHYSACTPWSKVCEKM